MKLNFNRVEMHNFMAFEDEVFDFSSMHGMTLVQGKNLDYPNLKNGSGKSTLFFSLLYALFGQLQQKIKNENIVTWQATEKDTRVVLFFDVDGAQYKIARGLNRGKSSYLELHSIQDGNEVDVTKSTLQETQAFIEEQLLHCDITIFLRTILLSADQTYNFYTLKKAEKKEFVEKLFDISLFEDMYQMIHKDKLALDKYLVSHQNQLLILNKNIDDYTERIASYESNHAQQLEAARQKTASIEAELAEMKKNEVKANQESVNKLNDAIEKIENAYRKVADESRDLSNKLFQYKSAKTKIEAAIESKNNVVESHSELLGKLCKDCQPIFKKHYDIDKIQNDVSQLQQRLAKADDAIAQVEAEFNKKQAILSQIEDKKTLANKKMHDVMKDQVKYNSDLSNLESSLRVAKSQLKSLNESKNPYLEMLESAKSQAESTTKSIDTANQKRKYLEFAENVVSQDTLRKFIIKDLVVLLNNRIKTYLTKLAAKYYVEFDEDMDYVFRIPNGTCEFGNFSAGERMRLMIATSFAFRDFMSIRNGLNSNILILDEYFDSAIDSLCIESILKILEEYKTKMNQSIFVISHRQEVNLDQFDHTIVVEKSNGSSHVVIQ